MYITDSDLYQIMLIRELGVRREEHKRYRVYFAVGTA